MTRRKNGRCACGHEFGPSLIGCAMLWSTLFDADAALAFIVFVDGILFAIAMR